MSDPKKFPFQPGSKSSEPKKDQKSTYHDMNTIQMNNPESEQSHNPNETADDATKKIPRIPIRESSPNITPMPDQEEDPEGSFRIGPYLVFRELAKGGMGAVYDGTDRVLQRRVAIKIMDEKLIDDQEAVKRFQREARATASIDHPNIARIYMVGMTESDAPFIAMEFIDGGTLERVISNPSSFSLSKVADFFLQACEGLKAAKKKSIIHRDIKPANIMISRTGTVKLVDFGLAKFFHEETFHTVAGMVMGTPRYMSPEQAQGRNVDHRSDIYSLGATLYHVLSGCSPFDGENPTQIMMKQVTAPLISIRSINPDVPLEFEELVKKCMAKDPSDRFQEYDEFASELSKLKLQFRSREEGSFLGDNSLIPSGTGMDTRGNPLPPEPTNYQTPGSGSSTQVPTGIIHEEPEEVPAWRWPAIIGAGFVVVLIIAVMIINSLSQDEEEQTTQHTDKKTGLQVLLEAIMDAQEGNDDEPQKPQINADYVAYLATREIIADIGEGVEDYRNFEGQYPAKLRDLVRDDVIFQNFDVASDDTPMDGWKVHFEYLAGSRTVISAGLDGDHFTDDDIIFENDHISIRGESGESTYTKMEEEEGKRQEALSDF